MRHDMSGNSLIKISQGVQRKGNRLLNGNTGGKLLCLERQAMNCWIYWKKVKR